MALNTASVVVVVRRYCSTQYPRGVPGDNQHNLLTDTVNLEFTGNRKLCHVVYARNTRTACFTLSHLHAFLAIPTHNPQLKLPTQAHTSSFYFKCHGL